jgi:hypothetical protein
MLFFGGLHQLLSGGEPPTKINHNFCGLNVADINYLSFIGLWKN